MDRTKRRFIVSESCESETVELWLAEFEAKEECDLQTLLLPAKS